MTTKQELEDSFTIMSAVALRVKADRDSLRAALVNLMPYREHAFGCAIAMTEFCTCGMKEAADAARLILNQTEGA